MTSTHVSEYHSRPTNGLRWSIQPGCIVGDDLSGPPYLTSSTWSYCRFCSSWCQPAHEGRRCRPPTKPSQPPTRSEAPTAAVVLGP
jgi:hypothetical protein